VLAGNLPRSWSAALAQLRRDVTTVGRRVTGHHPPPLVKGFERSAAPPALPTPNARGRAEARELVVARVIRETVSAVTLVLRAPDNETFAFLPGQFFTLLTEIEGEIVPRNYSASNVPGEAELHLTIKTKTGGRVSPVLSRTRPGDSVRVLGPFGSFVLPVLSSLPARRRLVLVAGGAGITPLASIARTVLATEPHSEVALLYANRRATRSSPRSLRAVCRKTRSASSAFASAPVLRSRRRPPPSRLRSRPARVPSRSA
jgi:hypothetical protein